MMPRQKPVSDAPSAAGTTGGAKAVWVTVLFFATLLPLGYESWKLAMRPEVSEHPEALAQRLAVTDTTARRLADNQERLIKIVEMIATIQEARAEEDDADSVPTRPRRAEKGQRTGAEDHGTNKWDEIP